MKKTNVFKQCQLLVPKLFLLLLIGFLSSCQHEEIIALEEENIDVEELTVEGDDPDMIFIGKNGESFTEKTLVGDTRYTPLFTLHTDNYFWGRKLAIFAYSASNNSFNLTDYSFNDRVSSLTVPAGCNVTVYEHTNSGGKSFNVNNYYGDTAIYATLGTVINGKSLSSTVGNDKVSSIRIYCNPGKSTAGNLCGFADKSTNTNTSSSKYGLPIYYNTPLSYDQLNWWNWKTIKSFVFVGRNKCGSGSQNGVSFFPNKYDKSSANPAGSTNYSSVTPQTFNLSNTRVYSIVPRGSYLNTHLLSSSNKQAVQNKMTLTYDELDTSPGTLTTAEANACETSYNSCIQPSTIVKGLGYLGAWGCPLTTIAAGSYETVKSYNDGQWGTAVIEGGEVAAQTYSSIAIAIVAPEIAAVSCIFSSIYLAGGYSMQVSCANVRTKCRQGLG